MDNIIHPFQIPIYQSFIEEDSFTQIKKDIDFYIKNYKEEFNLPWDCSTLSNINSSIKLKSPVLEDIIKKITINYFEAWGFEKKYKLYIKDIWVNISPPNSFQEVHNHIGPFEKHIFSGVFYIDVDKNSGNLNLINPIEDKIINLLPSSTIHSRITIPPENRKLICFPSWMLHYVGENKTNKPRISVSFNINVVLN